MTLSSTALLKHQGDITLKDVVTEPQEILALFASKKQQDKGKYFLTTARACSRFQFQIGHSTYRTLTIKDNGPHFFPDY